MGQRLNLGIVGCGDIARYMAQVSRLVPGVRLSACCDTNPGCLDAFARKYRIAHRYTRYEEMLADIGQSRLNAVYLAVPHHLHLALILTALEQDLPVLVEKPVTRTLAEGLRLLEAIQQQGGRVGVNYQYRYDRGCYALVRAVQEGALGQVSAVRINVPWRRQPDYFNGSPWHKTLAEAGGGTLITQGSHFIDIALWALGERPSSALGITATHGFDVEVETLAHGILETEGGTLINIASSMVAAREGAVTIEMYGEKGTAAYRDRPRPNVRFEGISPRRQRPPVWGVHALQRSLAGFARWVLEDIPYLTPAAEALPALAAVEAIYRSARSGCKEEAMKI